MSNNSSSLSKQQKDAPPLNPSERDAAMTALYDDSSISSFPRVERSISDPQFNNQVYALFSFIPSKHATPDKDGVYGLAKIRGTFPDPELAKERAEDLIKNHDSCHKIYTTYVGVPFPVTLESKWSAVRDQIDVRKKAIKLVSESIRESEKKDRKEINEIQERERKLLATQEEEEDPHDRYTTMKVKRAQSIWTYVENMKKLSTVLNAIITSEEVIKQMDGESSDYKESYMERYTSARKESGLQAVDLNNFMKYLDMEDVDLVGSWKEHKDLLSQICSDGADGADEVCGDNVDDGETQ